MWICYSILKPLDVTLMREGLPRQILFKILMIKSILAMYVIPKKTSTFLISEKLPFFMSSPLIVFIKTVGISQKNITKLSWYLYWQKKIHLHTHCAICRVPAPSNDPYYYETNSPFLCTLTTEIISVRALSSCPVLDLKKAFFYYL